MAESCNESIPEFNMQDLPEQLAKLVSACEEWGCFRIVNFNSILPTSLMLEMKEVARSLFELPLDVKKRNVDVIAGSGYMAPSKVNYLHEGLGIYDMSNADAIDDFCSILGVTPHQRAIITKYGEAVNELMTNLCLAIGKGSGIADFTYKDRVCHMRMNLYNFSAETIGGPGMQLHTDSGFLTVLHDDEIVGGLQVVKRSGTFIDVEPSPGSLTILLGDITTVWSNDRFLNVKHRVICKDGRPRVSIASVITGPKGGKIEVHDRFVDADHPRAYAPFSYSEYRSVRLTHMLMAAGAIDHFKV